jgi:hypothetical protein
VKPQHRLRVEHWSAEEREKRALLEQGVAVAVNMRRHSDLIAGRSWIDRCLAQTFR